MKKFFLSVFIAVLFLAATPAMAQIETYDFDTKHTQIMFSVNHLGYSNSYGKFLDFGGYFTFDRANPAASMVDVTIRTASINMDDGPWEDHLKNADFFNVEQFPEMTFKSTNIEVTGENTANITGDLTLLGVTKPVTLAVVHNKSEKRPFGEKFAAGFSATGSLKRSDFGMNYGLPMVSDDVKLIIEVEGERREEGGEGAVNK